jgi:lipopolysaccharide/colanic/teichoic acid biosynthesis glycosyltransferase
MRESRTGLASKRALDITVSAVGLIVTAPIQVVLAGVIAKRLGRPVFFVQPRPGRNGKVFDLVKFRTMLPVDETRGLVSDEDRMTTFGAFLRSTSLDELPTLWNVLRGDMSLVGPRPLLVRYLDRYSPRQARRHEVRPGVTGLAQISGRNAISSSTSATSRRGRSSAMSASWCARSLVSSAETASRPTARSPQRSSSAPPELSRDRAPRGHRRRRFRP